MAKQTVFARVRKAGGGPAPKPTSATLRIPVKDEKAMEHLFEAERHLHAAGVHFDTGYSTQTHERDWELDWSLKGAKLLRRK